MPASLTLPQPIALAAAELSAATPLGTRLSSMEIESGIAPEIRRSAFFSARVESVAFLAEAQREIEGIARAARGEGGATLDVPGAVARLRQLAERYGIETAPEEFRGTVRDIRSERRLRLIVELQLKWAQWRGQMESGNTPIARRLFPCWEFKRLEERDEERDWVTRWAEAGGRFYGGAGSNPDYPDAPGRMIARKDSPIWLALSRFGKPHPIFDYGSGMGWRPVSRRECEALGVIAKGETPERAEMPERQALEAPDGAAPGLLDEFFSPDEIEGEGGGLAMTPDSPAPPRRASAFPYPGAPQPPPQRRGAPPIGVRGSLPEARKAIARLLAKPNVEATRGQTLAERLRAILDGLDAAGRALLEGELADALEVLRALRSNARAAAKSKLGEIVAAMFGNEGKGGAE